MRLHGGIWLVGLANGKLAQLMVAGLRAALLDDKGRISITLCRPETAAG